MSSTPDGDNNWIGHVIDHFSKFHIIFPMKTKEAQEVADNLATKVFAKCMAYQRKQSDNGREFVNKVVRNLLIDWDGLCKTINGRPRHPQSQGAVERGNREVEKMIGNLRKSTQTNSWSSWCPQIQCMFNYFLLL